MKKKLIPILILPFFMSCKIRNENIPIPTPSPSVSIQPSTSPTESLEPTPTVTLTLTPSSAMPTSGFSPGSAIIDIPDIATILGKVYDQNGNLVGGAKVEAKFFRPDETFNGNTEYTLDGRFVIRNIPLGKYNEIKGEITVSKEGYKTVTRTVTIISEIKNQNDNERNTFNFGGTGEEAQYALIKIE